ncbi:hypothetical protein FHS72_000773 [Loktanella ponticola]|uniref:KfrA N-terminal DNA-binding domain-containing protein n=1 Tax=Yoonia ponticola TaxID=1524255 RepID=A0A7W9EYS3_9RHOB|nr:hypothetical protein [Yoonia ponticola]MBB5721166.1 hypothetical protein [Yoonia ponticola]
MEKAILAYMAAHDNQMPTIAELNRTIGTSNSRLCPAAKVVKTRLAAVQTKLASMPDIPEELSLSHEQALKAIWAKARSYQTAEIEDLKRSQAAKDEMYRNEIREMQEVIELVEAAEQKATQTAQETADALDASQKSLAETQAALIAAEARLAEQDKFVKLLAEKFSPEAADEKTEEAKPSSRRTKKTAASTTRFDEPETLDLPGVLDSDDATGSSQ